MEVFHIVATVVLFAGGFAVGFWFRKQAQKKLEAQVAELQANLQAKAKSALTRFAQ